MDCTNCERLLFFLPWMYVPKYVIHIIVLTVRSHFLLEWIQSKEKRLPTSQQLERQNVSNNTPIRYQLTSSFHIARTSQYMRPCLPQAALPLYNLNFLFSCRSVDIFWLSPTIMNVIRHNFHNVFVISIYIYSKIILTKLLYACFSKKGDRWLGTLHCISDIEKYFFWGDQEATTSRLIFVKKPLNV